MKRPVIALVSMLKPIDETRMYEKIGLSLGESTKYDVKIIGFTANKPEYAPNIKFFPLPFFKRFSFGRIRAQWSIVKSLFRTRPDLVIFMAPELLHVILIIRLFFRSKIVFDIQENYSLNIQEQQTYHRFIRPILPTVIRLGYWLTHPFIDHYLMAEKVYMAQLPMHRPATVLENKYAGKIGVPDKNKSGKTILFSGTLGRHTGILEAIGWTEELRKTDSTIRLRIAGFAPDSQFRKVLENNTKDVYWIDLKTGEQPLPHKEILSEISHANAGFIWYNDHPSTRGKIPTKLYEYIAMQLPIFLEPRKEWLIITDKYPAGLPVDLTRKPESSFLTKWQNMTFYTEKPGTEVTWKIEEGRLLNLIENLLRKG